MPRKKHGLAKPFWSQELTCLKQKSYDANNLWKSCGRPRHGPIHEEKIRCNLMYKSQLRKSKLDTSRSMSAQLSDNLLNNSFLEKLEPNKW